MLADLDNIWDSFVIRVSVVSTSVLEYIAVCRPVDPKINYGFAFLFRCPSILDLMAWFSGPVYLSGPPLGVISSVSHSPLVGCFFPFPSLSVRRRQSRFLPFLVSSLLFLPVHSWCCFLPFASLFVRWRQSRSLPFLDPASPNSVSLISLLLPLPHCYWQITITYQTVYCY